MELKLIRTYPKLDYTIGELYIDNVKFCDTLENRLRIIPIEGKVMGDTAIPNGKYKVVISYSNMFKRDLPLLLDVPYFSGIRIHRGNYAKDTEGCILLGENKQKGAVLNSTKYEKQIVELINKSKDDAYITIQ